MGVGCCWSSAGLGVLLGLLRALKRNAERKHVRLRWLHATVLGCVVGVTHWRHLTRV